MIAALLRRAASLHPRQQAVVQGERRWTYAELAAEVRALAACLAARGVGPGDRVAVLGENSAAFLVAYFAAAEAGWILTPLNHRLAPPELAFILEDAGARWVLADGRFAGRLQEAGEHVRARGAGVQGVVWLSDPPEPADAGVGAGAPVRWEEVLGTDADATGYAPQPGRGDDVAHLYYTSGTTGTPKGVMLTHRNVCVHAFGAIAELQITADDVWGHVAPLFHLADAWATFAVTAVGGRHVVVPRFEPAAVLAVLEREAVTLTNLVPTMLNLMVKHPGAAAYDLSAFRLLLSGGAPIAPALVEALVETFGVEYVQTYGMTETSPYLTLSTLSPRLRRLPAAEQLRYRARTGRPFLTVELRVVDAEGTPVAPDDETVGEIQVRGESVTPGYWNRPAETAAAFTSDGWLRTGDLAVVDPEGYVDIVDRLKDMILTGGENVYSTEVEHVLYRHLAVLEAAVIGVPDPVFGEAVLAAVVPRPDQALAPEGLVAHCRAHLAGYKIPRRVELLKRLPRTGSGKIRKQSLRERFGKPRP